MIGVLLGSIETLINKSGTPSKPTSPATTDGGSSHDAEKTPREGSLIEEENVLPTLGKSGDDTISEERSKGSSTPADEKQSSLKQPLEPAADARDESLLDLSERHALVKQLRMAIFFGAGAGLLVAFAIGAAFLAVFYTQANDLYGKAEELWEGIFNLIAAALIIPMALALLRLGQAKEKWSRKLHSAFHNAMEKQKAAEATPSKRTFFSKWTAARSKPVWIVFTIPFLTTLREGVEGVIFIGGVSLGLPATSIPLPAIVGLAVGFGIGVLIWRGGPRVASISYFLVGATCFLMIIAVGMATRAVYYLQFYRYVQLVGDGAAESGDGPGSYDATGGIVAHFNFGNPENNKGGTGWGVLSSLCGWLNTWTYGTVLTYNLLWLAITAYLLYALHREGRLKLFSKRR